MHYLQTNGVLELKRSNKRSHGLISEATSAIWISTDYFYGEGGEVLPCQQYILIVSKFWDASTWINERFYGRFCYSFNF